MSGLNKGLFLGHLGADPELRVIQNGQALLRFDIACSESYLDRNRVRQERTEWVRCVIWGRRAESLSKILHKGSKIFVEGKITTRSYDDRNGVKRYVTEVVVQQVVLGGGARARRAPSGDPEQRRANRREHYDGGSDSGGNDSGGYDDGDYGSAGYDDIPF